MLRIRFVFIFYVFAPAFIFGQQASEQDTVKREAVIHHEVNGNAAKFYAATPPLQQIPGAPKAFYDFYWEFGDGHYSFEEAPVHTYEKEGEHAVMLWTTNNYDNGKPPPSRPQKVQIKKITQSYSPPSPLPEAESFELKNNREPVPEEEMVVIVRYKNESDYPADGKLYIFFNEEKFKADNFTLKEVRTHHGERSVPDAPLAVARIVPLSPSSLWAANTTSGYRPPQPYAGADRPLAEELEAGRMHYRNTHVLEFDGMAAGESRNVFYSFQTTPDMLKDTSAMVKIKGVYVPERSGGSYRKKELEMEILNSHDPNKMSVSDTRLNYRMYRHKTLDFKIRFQNNGEGPASSIKLNVDVPPMYDKRSLKITDVYPPCPVCPDSVAVSYGCIDTVFTKDRIVFHFRNIYLPGSNQKNVEKRDSTKGFVKYSLRFNPSVDKQRTRCRTAIIFDKNEPIITNYAVTRFKPGLSPGVKAGYDHFPSLEKSRSFFIGVTASPYKSFRGYLQAELMAGVHSYSDADSARSETLTPIPGMEGFYDLYEMSRKFSYQNIVLTLVPVSYRYNVNKFLGFGAGIQLSADLAGEIEEKGTAKYSLYIESENAQQRDRTRDRVLSGTKSAGSFSQIDTGLFADIALGSARIGPALGARYIYHFNDPHIQYQFYARWKF